MFSMRVWAGFPARPKALFRAFNRTPRPSAVALLLAAAAAFHPARAGASIAADFILPQTAQAAPDLDLSPANARRAEAMAHFIRGTIAEENAETDQALAAFQSVLDLDPACADIAVKVAFEMAKRGEITEGINTLKDAISASPKNPLLLLYLSQLYARHLKKFDTAIRHAEAAFALDPASIAAYACLFELRAAAGQSGEAAKVLDRAKKIERADAEFWIQLADLAIRLAQKGEKQPGPADRDRVLGFLEKAAAAAGDQPEPLAKVADFYLLARQVKPAIALYRKIIAASPGSDDPVTVAAEDKLARALYADEDPDGAIAVLEKLAAKQPERYETHEMLGEMLEEKGDAEGALQAYRSSLLLDPNQPLNHLRVSDLLLHLQRPEEAVEQLRFARERFPDLPQITYSLAIALGRARRHGESLAMFEAALSEAKRSNPQLLNGAFYFAFGAAAEQAGQIDLAADLLRTSIRLDPANAAQAMNYIGYMWADRNTRLDEAGQMIDGALAREPDNPAFLDSKGWLLHRLGRHGEALPLLLRAASLISPEDPVIRDHLGDVLSALGRRDEALAQWEKAASLAPENRDLQEKIRRAREPAP